jgi:hypothetical protein
MRYFHRTTLSPDDVIAEADRYFGERLQAGESRNRMREFSGSIGTITVKVEAEGGHYTLVTLRTDQVGESEADKVGKRFLTILHSRVEPGRSARGAY